MHREGFKCYPPAEPRVVFNPFYNHIKNQCYCYSIQHTKVAFLGKKVEHQDIANI